MTDYEDFISTSGRDKKVQEVRKKINDLGIQYIYYQFVSVTGRIMGKGAPADHWERFAEKGFQLVYGSTANLFIDRHDQYIGYGPEAWELVGIPEPETFVQLPWDKRVARVFCTLFRGREHPEDPGAFLTSDCRGNLRRLHKKFQDEHGLQLRAGTEPEMMWLKRDSEGNPDGGYSKPFCYHIDQFESLRPVYMQVIEYARQMGLDIIQGDHEDAPGQLELNFTFDDVLRNADRLTTYRQICAQVARENNLIACFMSKPFMSVSASACHTNISLWRGGETEVKKLGNNELPGMEEPYTYAKGGENTFMPEGDNPRDPGEIGKYALGGILKHQRGLTILGCSNVNSYRRLLDTGFWAPVFANWGYQNRTASIRNSAPGRFEYKTVDSAHNPYLLGAGLLQTMSEGIANKIDPGEPEQRNIYDVMEEVEEKYTKIPISLGEALEALGQDKTVKTALPGEMYKVFEHYKRDEWETFLATVTQWDLENYIDCLP
ncbi:glutamine synthetase [Methylohalomonas lacus]|uniref:Glutamine synthetase n=1 Tax=Methylohalomonas lacus TaxID=398773 RepID=A0AAE3HK89_9GAMM|nr:glutamine synthetase family protein [Methylohalomonas lacus]MCS3903846.1 glutamine synthetase [Methylohalomonas lacus]